jgi:hypothetical protein
MRGGSEAARTRTRRRPAPRRARDLGTATRGDTAPRRTGCRLDRHRSNAPALDVLELAVGPFVGPNPAVLGRIRPNAAHVTPRLFGCLVGFAGISAPGSPTNAMLHTREDAGSKPAAPIRKMLICRYFVGVAMRPRYARGLAFRCAPTQSLATDPDERITRASSRLTREKSPRSSSSGAVRGGTDINGAATAWAGTSSRMQERRGVRPRARGRPAARP